MGFLDQLTGLARGDNAAVAENPKLLPGGPTNFFQLFSRIPITPTVPEDFAGSSRVHSTAEAAQTGAQAGSPTHSFWSQVKEGSTPLGSTIQSLLGTLAMGGLGAGIGAIASPGARGLGAARGFGVGAVKGIDQDLAMRKSAAQMPQNLLDDQLKQMQLKQAQANLDPQSHREYQLAYPNGEKSYADFLKEGKINPVALANLGLSQQRFGFEQQKFGEQMAQKQQLKDKEKEDISNLDELRSQYNTIRADIAKGSGPSTVEGGIYKYAPFGERIVQEINPDRALAFKNIADVQAKYAKSISGSAISEPEAKRLAATQVSQTDDAKVASALLDNLSKKATELRFIKLLNHQKAGKNVSEFESPDKLEIYEHIRDALNKDFNKAIKDPDIQRARKYLGIDYGK